MGNVREQRREELHDAGRGTPVEAERIRSARASFLPKIPSADFTGTRLINQ